MNALPDNRIDRFNFDISDHDTRQSFAEARKLEFKSDFNRELDRLQAWALAHRWDPLQVPGFRVTVSDKYWISKALFPAWSGRLGHMEFPTRRVGARTAAIAHELTHVFFPNGNRFLAEGLAVYIQAEIGGNPAFPNFGRPLHELAGERLQDMIPELSHRSWEGLDKVHLDKLDEIPTPNPLVLEVGNNFYGEEPRGQGSIYPIAGSFIQFLIETKGLDKFRDLYSLTPLVPLSLNAGLTDRWRGVYDAPLGELAQEWKTTMFTGQIAGSQHGKNAGLQKPD
jgi:hypothetical protein